MEPIMQETPESTSSVSEIQTRLNDVAAMLQESGSIEPESQRVLIELVDELNKALLAVRKPGDELSQLAESTARLAESLHRQQELGILSKARDRLELAVSNAETHAPVAVGVARRLLETLANIGI
jgi:hypothetical protein